MLRIDTTPTPVPQGARINATVVLESGSRRLGAAVLEICGNTAFFDQLTLSAGTAIVPADTWQSNEVTPGLFRVALALTAPRAGALALIEISAVAVGRRGAEFDLTCRLLDGADEDFIPLIPESVEVGIPVAAGAPGIYALSPGDAFLTIPCACVLHAEGGTPPYLWTAGAAMPPGLVLDPSGLLVGTPSATGDFAISIQLLDAAGVSVAGALPFHVSAEPLRISVTELPAAAPGFPYSLSLRAQGGKSPIHWECRGLPPGLAANGDRIEGTLSSTANLGFATIDITARDADSPAQIAITSLQMPLEPAREISCVSVPGVTAVCIAPNLLVEEYIVEVDYLVATTSQGMQAEIGGILDSIAEDLFREIVSLDCLDVVRPPGQRPGLQSDLPTGGPTCRERLIPLLDEYRSVRDARQGPTVGFSEIMVAIDGEAVLRYSRHGPRRTPSTLRQSDLRASPSLVSRKLAKALADNGKIAGRYRQLLDDEIENRLRKSAPKKSKAALKRPILSSSAWEWLRFRLENLFSYFDEINWTTGAPASANSTVVRLTTGPHQVAVRGTAIISATPGALYGSNSSATISYSVRIRARNPAWPRLRGELLLSEGGGSGFEHVNAVSIPGAAMDVAAAGSDGLVLIPSTGDGAAPFASPRRFPESDGVRPALINGHVRDGFGRTWLVAADGATATIFRNRGIGGFARHAATLPSASGSLSGLDIFPRTPTKVADMVVAVGAGLFHVTGLGRLKEGLPASVTALPVTPLPTADTIAAICGFHHDVDWVAVTWAISGRVSLMRRTGSVFERRGFHSSFQGRHPLLDLSGVGAFPDSLVVAARQERSLTRTPFGVAVAPSSAPQAAGFLPLGPNLLAPAFDGWLAATLGLGRQVLLLRADGQQFIIPALNDVSSLNGTGTLLAAARHTAGEIRIWSSNGTEILV